MLNEIAMSDLSVSNGGCCTERFVFISEFANCFDIRTHPAGDILSHQCRIRSFPCRLRDKGLQLTLSQNF